MNFKKPVYFNDREKQEFTERLEFTGENYLSKAGDRLLLPLNFFIPRYYSITGSGVREQPLVISRGNRDKDVFEFVLPEGFEYEAIPEVVSIEGEFGSFKMEVQVKEDSGKNILLVQRDYILKDGTWPAESITDFRNFMNQLNALANQKAVLIKSK